MKWVEKRISKRQFNCADVEKLIAEIDTIINNKSTGHTEVSEDDIKELKVIGFLLKQYEGHSTSVNFTTQDEHLSHHKTKQIVEDLELNRIITKPLMGFGGVCFFEVLDRIAFRDFLYGLTIQCVHKLPQDRSIIEWFKKLNWKDNSKAIMLMVIGTVIATLITTPIINYFYHTDEPTRIEVKGIGFDTTFFSCNKHVPFNVEYKVAHISGKNAGFSQPFYVFLNQTNNNCLNNYTFFNSTPEAHLLCFNTQENQFGKQETCTPMIDPLSDSTSKVISNMNDIGYNLINTFFERNVTTCNLTEQIKVCVTADDNTYCSEPKTADISYQGCNNQI
jgi:hypothetical protein